MGHTLLLQSLTIESPHQLVKKRREEEEVKKRRE